MTSNGARIYVDWNGDGDWGEAYEEITAYIYSAEWSYGRDSYSQLKSRCNAGVCNIELNNRDGRFSSFNVGSPIHGFLLPRRKVKITTTYGGSTVTQWIGYVDSIKPAPSPNTDHKALLRAVGPLAILNKCTVSIAMQTNITTGAAITLILQACGLTAGDYSIDTGQSTMARWWTGTNVNALQACRMVEETECGFLRESKDGKIVFEDRAHRASSPHTVSQATYTTTAGANIHYSGISQEDACQEIFNSVWADVGTPDISETETLWELTAAPPAIPGSGSITIWADYLKINNTVSVNSWGTVTHTANTAADGSGTDKTSSVTITKTAYATSCKLVIANADAGTVYLTSCSIAGSSVVQTDVVKVHAEDATSQTKYGLQEYVYPGRFVTDIAEGQALVNHILAMYKDPRAGLTITLDADGSAEQMAEALARDVSDRVTIVADATSTTLGINEDFFVERVSHRLDRVGNSHRFTVQCGAIVSHSWSSCAYPRTPRTLQNPYPKFDRVIPGVPTSVTLVARADTFVGDWGKPATGKNSLDDVCIQWSVNADMSSPTTTTGYGVIFHGETVMPGVTVYFRVAWHNLSDCDSNATVEAALDAAYPGGDFDHGWGAFCTTVGPVSTTAAAIPANSVTSHQLSGEARSQHGVFFETFEGAISDYAWTDGATPGGSQTIESGNGQAGGKTYKTTGYVWKIYTSNIPYDPSKLYRLRVRLKEDTGGTRGYVYIGVEGVAADGVTLVAKDGNNTHGNQYYVVASADQPALDTWVVYTGWMKGWSASPDGAPAPLATAPGPLHTNVRYIRPMFVVNYSSGTATVRIDEISIDICDEGSTDRAYRALDSNGDIINTRKISGRSEALSTTLQHISSTGTVDSLDNVGDGSTYKRTTANERDGGGRAYAGLDEDGFVSKTLPLLMHDADVRGGASRANTGLDENGKVALKVEVDVDSGSGGSVTGGTVTGTVVNVLTTGMDDPCFTIGSTSLTEGDLIAIKAHCGV